jgi:ubiquinone/menaquinone biosynthesis C-methylase UbiE
MYDLPCGALHSTEITESYRDVPASELAAIIDDIGTGMPWRAAVRMRYAETNPWLHRIVTDPSRDLFFRQYPPSNGSRILDIGAGWGQIAIPLAQNSFVCALEPTPERLRFIHAAAKQEGIADKMWFVQADFCDIDFNDRFDLVTCIGVLEWVPSFRNGRARDTQLEFLGRIRRIIKTGGACCIGIENRLGLKYLLGARDDHTGHRSINVLDADLAMRRYHAATGKELRAFTYTQAEYRTLFQESGFSQIETFVAFPDYKLPRLIIPCSCSANTNQSLAQVQLPAEHDGVDGHMLSNTEDIHSHYRSLAALGIAHLFAPSFYFILR